jgi:ribosomal protein S12 methylthiotransferase
VVDEVKHERRDLFMRQQQKIAAKRAKRFVGETLPMLVEGVGEDEDGAPVLAGRTYREAPEVDGMVFARGAASIGDRILVHIDEAADYDLFATVV